LRLWLVGAVVIVDSRFRGISRSPTRLCLLSPGTDAVLLTAIRSPDGVYVQLDGWVVLTDHQAGALAEFLAETLA
jgi:hypothetical protein